MVQTRTVALTPETPREDADVLLAASRSEPNSREKVRDLLTRCPEWVERLGSLADDAERALIEPSRDQVLLQESVRAELRSLREELRQPCDGALESLIVRRIALCWAALNTAEEQRACKWQQGISDASAVFWDRHVSRLHSDFLRACRTLATVRKLRLPSVQVNIGAQQVNVQS